MALLASRNESTRTYFVFAPHSSNAFSRLFQILLCDNRRTPPTSTWTWWASPASTSRTGARCATPPPPCIHPFVVWACFADPPSLCRAALFGRSAPPAPFASHRLPRCFYWPLAKGGTSAHREPAAALLPHRGFRFRCDELTQLVFSLKSLSPPVVLQRHEAQGGGRRERGGEEGKDVSFSLSHTHTRTQ